MMWNHNAYTNNEPNYFYEYDCCYFFIIGVPTNLPWNLYYRLH